jgi:hypothetical protein
MEKSNEIKIISKLKRWWYLFDMEIFLLQFRLFVTILGCLVLLVIIYLFLSKSL